MYQQDPHFVYTFKKCLCNEIKMSMYFEMWKSNKILTLFAVIITV